MKYLLDTNLLLRLANIGDAQHQVAGAALAALYSRRAVICIVPQVIHEFWVASTRPKDRNGLGYSPVDAANTVSQWANVFKLIEDAPEIHSVWFDLVQRYSVSGKPAHDTRLVAAMIKHGIDRLLTFNDGDFKRYTEIVAESPLATLRSP